MSTQPGWYPDPKGDGLRWWDGTTWTGDVAPAPGQAAVDEPDAAPADGDGLDVPVVAFEPFSFEVGRAAWRRRLVVDDRTIAWGKAVVPYESLRTIGYSMTRQRVNGIPTATNYVVVLGHEQGRTKIAFNARGFETKQAQEQTRNFSIIVAALHQFAAPRIMDGIGNAVEQGHSVDVGGFGLARPGLTKSGMLRGEKQVPWPDVAGATLDAGFAHVFAFDPGAKQGQKRIGSVGMAKDNAPLLPDLLPELRRRFV